MSKKLNMFVGATTFGVGFVGTFDIGAEQITNFIETKHSASTVCTTPSVYEKQVDMTKITTWASTGSFNSIQGHKRAIDTENKRVGALNALVQELESFSQSDETAIITCNIPECLCSEIYSGRVKYVLSGETENSFFSAIELELWKKFMVLHQTMYHQLVFNPLEKVALLRKGEPVDGLNPIRARRITIYAQMRQDMLNSYNTERNARIAVQQQVASMQPSAFTAQPAQPQVPSFVV